jgi:hypothetical protein
MDQRDEMLLALEDPTTAIVAHGLLNSMAVLTGTATTMLDHWDKVIEDPERGRELLLRIVRQASMASGVLEDLVRGLPPQVTNTLVVLDGLRGAEAPAS